MNHRGITIVLLTILALALIPATAGANGSRGYKKHSEGHRHYVKKDHDDDDDNGYRGGRLTHFKKKLSESPCSSIEGRAKGLCYAYCEVLDCDSQANQGRRICQGLSQRYQRITDTNLDPPCAGTVQTASCPCFGDLSELGFTNSATCSSTTGIAQINEFNGTFLIAEGGATSTFSGCQLNGVAQTSIPNNEATACVDVINQFCEAMP